MILAAGIVVPLAVEGSNGKKIHLPTTIFAYFSFLSGLSLRGLVSEFVDPNPGRRRYIAVKLLVHACALLLVFLSFSLALMMRMSVVATSITVAAAAVFVAHRLWQCAAAPLDADLIAFMGCEEELHQLLDLSTGVTSTLFGGWYGTAFYYYQNYAEEASDARLVPSEYLTFFTSVVASLVLVKAVPRRHSARPARELMALACALASGVAATALVVAASKVGGYAALALVPEAVAFAAWCANRADHMLPVIWPEWLSYGHGGGGVEPASNSFVGVSSTLLLAVLSYRVKDARAFSTAFDNVFIVVTTSAVVAALGWRLLTQPPTPIRTPGVQAAAKILSFATFWLLLLSVLIFLGVMLGW
ncbi:unnamed protein product [Urochloa humidicola]